MARPSVQSQHTFVVPAFGEPRWLDRCLASLQQQSLASAILISTSTPNTHISSIAGRRQIPIVVNPVAAGIASDWNFALAQAASEWVSLAHQDDWYETDYVETCLNALTGVPNAVLIFTDATERIDGKSGEIANTRVKRAIANLAFLTNRSIDARWRKRLLLSFGNPIPCPSVMINRRMRPAFRFPEGWHSNLDWRAWLALASEPGAFVYVSRRLVTRTLHLDGATTRALEDRAREDARMFGELWPAPMAAALNRLYAPSRNPYRILRQRR
ncbi:MAG TPA: glycosyltransferase family 2 protein [Vicinamibacterales bacterium]|nr:glycosyltransferase family 2 protein [Vicinamibacterales bacterium]